MPLRDSEAIVLRSFPLGEADRLVSFLSRTLGRLRGVAPGARRTKSRFGATLEPLSHIRIWFFERENRDLVRINQCEMLESFFDSQRDYRAGVALALVSEITEAVLPEREPSDPAFRLLLHVARAMRDTHQVDVPLAYFALWTVRLGGWLGELDRCTRCGRALGESAAFAAVESPGLACAACKYPGMRTLSPRALAAARRMLGSKLDPLLENNGLPAAARELNPYLLDLIEQQAERRLQSRPLLESAT